VPSIEISIANPLVTPPTLDHRATGVAQEAMLTVEFTGIANAKL
jgi:hypothetical protein